MRKKKQPQLPAIFGSIPPKPQRELPFWPLLIIPVLIFVSLLIYGIQHPDKVQNVVIAPTITATTPPNYAPSPTLQPRGSIGAIGTLGGTPMGFTQRFGTPVFTTPSTLHYVGTIATHAVEVSIDLERGNDGQPHVFAVSVFPPEHSGDHWDDATTHMITAALLPGDTQGIADGKAHSDNLAATFAGSLFADEYGNQVASGTFIIMYSDSYGLLRIG